MLIIFKNKIRVLKEKGLFHIFGTSIINKILSFFTNIFVVNFLTKTDYGILGYSNNLLNIFILFSGLGLTSGILQFCSEKRDKKEIKAIYRYGFMSGVLLNVLLSIIIFIFSRLAPIQIEESRNYISILSIMPVVQYMYDYITTILRTKKMNKQYAAIQNLNVFLYFVCSIMGAYKFGILGVIFGRYLSFIFTFIFALMFLKTIHKEVFNKMVLKKTIKNELVKYSIICCASNSISQLLYLLDIFFIGTIIANEIIIAEYQVSTLIPNAFLFIPLNLMVFIYPYIAEKKDDKKWVRKIYIRIITLMGLFNLIIGLVLFILAPVIINILWGKEYLGSVTSFRILALSFVVSSTFRIPSGNILAMIRKVNVNLFISLISGLANIVLDIILIRKLGATGAAIATLFVVIISSIISTSYIFIHLNKNQYRNKDIMEAK